MSPAAAGPRARVFVGLPLAPELCAEVHGRVAGALEAGRARPGFRRTEAVDLHLTLAFVGEVERERLTVLGTELEQELGGRPAPRLRLAGTGAFPERGRERVLWVGVEERAPRGRLGPCRQAALEALSRAGCELPREERERFHPHITVARPRQGPRARVSPAPEEFYRLTFDAAWDPGEVVCFESLAGLSREPGTGHYRALTRIAFCAG